jgi:hypothetical protein
MPGPPGAWNSLTGPGEGMKVRVLGVDAAFDRVPRALAMSASGLIDSRSPEAISSCSGRGRCR